MPSDISNDNAYLQPPEVSDHGQAALLLTESLIHILIARDVLTVADAIEAIDVAAEVRADLAAEKGFSASEQRRMRGLLDTISSSLRRDHPGP